MTVLDPTRGRGPIAAAYREIEVALQREVDVTAFEPRAYDPASVRAACTHWRKRMVDEYVSTTVFSGLQAQLLEANASIDAGAVMLRMSQDELRHAEICGRVVRAMGGEPRVTHELRVAPLARHPGCSAQERAMRNVIVASISETFSVAFFVASLDRMEDPTLRTVSRSLLSDEVLHARFGFHYLAAWSEWLGARPDVRASISGYLRRAFAFAERELVLSDRSVREHGVDDDRLGLVPRDVAREMFYATMAEAVVPGLEHFGLDAKLAFDARTLDG